MVVAAEPGDERAVMLPGEVAEVFDVTPKTIARWADAGVLPADRTPGGHRRFHARDVLELVVALAGVGEP